MGTFCEIRYAKCFLGRIFTWPWISEDDNSNAIFFLKCSFLHIAVLMDFGKVHKLVVFGLWYFFIVCYNTVSIINFT